MVGFLHVFMVESLTKIFTTVLICFFLTGCWFKKPVSNQILKQENTEAYSTEPTVSAIYPSEKQDSSNSTITSEEPAAAPKEIHESSPVFDSSQVVDSKEQESPDFVGIDGDYRFEDSEKNVNSSLNSLCDLESIAEVIPPRSETAVSGTEFVNEVRKLIGLRRDEEVLTQLREGNIPNHIRKFHPITFSGEEISITVCVSTDYLAVGSDDDFVRFPLGLSAVNSLFKEWNFILPTVKIVDQTFSAASLKIAPSPKKPGSTMESTDYIFEHNQTIQSQIENLNGLIAGHKKDLVISTRLLKKPDRVAIYGWHSSNGNPIQPLSTVHHKDYADYSHGVRLVSNQAFLNEQPVLLSDLLQISEYAALINPLDGVIILPH